MVRGINPNVDKFRDFCTQQHDIVCNQKYDETLPYSFHLNAVASQVTIFFNIIKSHDLNIANIYMGCYGHDLIEDARMTYNDIKELTNESVADIIYCCTEEKGKDRASRHNQKYFDELKVNNEAVFVKLCDIIANLKYSLLTNSSMFTKYKKEYPHLKSELYREEYDEMFKYIERLLTV